MTATRAEAGNLDYRFSPDLDEPDRFNLIEQWEDEDAMTAHMASPHLAEFLTAPSAPARRLRPRSSATTSPAPSKLF